MTDVELSQERCGKVGLVHQRVYLHGLFYRTAHPNHRYVVYSRGMDHSLARIIETVVGQTDYEHVLPLRKFLQSLYELAQMIVGKGKRVFNLILELIEGNVERIMTAQCKKACVPRTAFSVLYVVVKPLEGNVVVNAPHVLQISQFKVHVSRKLLITTAQQITLHVSKVDVTAVKEVCLISCLGKFSCNGGQRAALCRNLHYRVCRETLVTAQCADGTSVGTVAVGIAVVKEYALLCVAVKVGRYVLLAAQRFYEHSSVALHKYNQDVRSLSVQ